VFDAAGDLRDDRLVGREVDRPRVDDVRRRRGHDGADARAVAAQFVREFDDLHRRDAPRDAERDVDPVQHYRDRSPRDGL